MKEIVIIKTIKDDLGEYAWIYDGEALKRVPVYCICSQVHTEDITKELVTPDKEA